MKLKRTNITIVGIGLMGGSILKTLKEKANKPKKIIAYDIDDRVLNKIKELDLADVVTKDVNLALKDSDLVVVALYPKLSFEFIKDNAKLFKKGAIITDICGIKRELVKEIPKLLNEDTYFVGAHPMAGREHKGFDESRANLFNGCNYIIDNSAECGTELVIEFAQKLGAGKIVMADSELHDELIAYTSQLPHVLSIAYMLCAGERDVEDFSAGSFRDVTRVAMINDEMWSELFIENKDMLVKEIKRLREKLNKLEEQINNDEKEKLREEMKKAAFLRNNVD